MDNYGKQSVQMGKCTTYFQNFDERECEIRKTILIKNLPRQLINNVLICGEDPIFVT